jgi:hypothetical protein
MNSSSGLTWCGRVAAALVVCIFLSGCGSKVTKTNFEKIKTGMSRSEVEGILGSANRSFDQMGITVALWHDDDNAISVMFKDNKVAAHYFVNAKEFNQMLNGVKIQGTR